MEADIDDVGFAVALDVQLLEQVLDRRLEIGGRMRIASGRAGFRLVVLVGGQVQPLDYRFGDVARLHHRDFAIDDRLVRRRAIGQAVEIQGGVLIGV